MLNSFLKLGRPWGCRVVVAPIQGPVGGGSAVRKGPPTREKRSVRSSLPDVPLHSSFLDEQPRARSTRIGIRFSAGSVYKRFGGVCLQEEGRVRCQSCFGFGGHVRSGYAGFLTQNRRFARGQRRIRPIPCPCPLRSRQLFLERLALEKRRLRTDPGRGECGIQARPLERVFL